MSALSIDGSATFNRQLGCSQMHIQFVTLHSTNSSWIIHAVTNCTDHINTIKFRLLINTLHKIGNSGPPICWGSRVKTSTIFQRILHKHTETSVWCWNMNTIFTKRLWTMKLYNTTSEYERVTIAYRSWNYHLQIHSFRKQKNASVVTEVTLRNKTHFSMSVLNLKDSIQYLTGITGTK
jgi:hypothetical protein